MTVEQYERLKRFIGLFYDWYMKGPHSHPDSHPLVVMEGLVKKSPAKARSGLVMAVNDTVEMTSDWSREKVAEADRRFTENGAPSLSEIRRTYSKKYQRILKRGSIKSLEEYYMVKGILDGGVIEADAPERADLFAMLGSYESRVIPGSKK
jgi:hypothetical protein